jgi:hypothetical protein
MDLMTNLMGGRFAPLAKSVKARLRWFWHKSAQVAARLERNAGIPKKSPRRKSFRRFWRTHPYTNRPRHVRRAGAKAIWRMMGKR